MLYNAKEHTLKLPGLQADYITFGRGKKALVMIQGLNTGGIKGAALSLAYMYRIFAQDYTVYLFDRKKNLPENVTVKELAGDIAAAMDSLGIKKADVFGVSQGGMIAQYLCIDRPDLVNKLVLAVTLCQNNETAQSAIDTWVELAQKGDAKAMTADMAARMYSARYAKRYKMFMPLLALLQKPKDVPRFVNLAKACLTCDTRDLLHQIKCPVFVIGGKKDMVVGDGCQKIADILSCRLYLYDDLGHAAYEEALDFNQRVYDFLTE